MATAISSDTQLAGTAIYNPSTNDVTTPFIEPGYASTGFIFTMSALVFLMTPGLGLFYSGMSRSKNALSLIMVCMLAMSVVTVQWFLFGFSLSFSESGSAFMGNFHHGGLHDVGAGALAKTAPAIPAVLYCLYQLMFATLTPALIFGSVAERIRLIPAMIFIFCWATVVYDPVAYWTWSYRGWLRSVSCVSTTSDTPCGLGSLDFAGGGPVHVASGFAGLAYCLILGKRRRTSHEDFKAHNLTNVFLGTGLLWFGWFGFNGGSALAATPRAVMAGLVTTIATASGSLTWVLVDYFHHGKLSGLGYCSGAVAGLVGITPAAGFVAPWAGFVIGVLASFACNHACRLKGHLGFDDSLDAWGVHGVGGVVGNLLTGIFAQTYVAALDGTVIEGGWLDGNYKQLGYQIAGTAAIAAWSFVVSSIILLVINHIPGLQLRLDESDEALGADLGEMGELAYELIPSSVSHSNLLATTSSEKVEGDPRTWNEKSSEVTA